MKRKLNRRNFINAASVVGAGLATGVPLGAYASGDRMKTTSLSGNEPGHSRTGAPGAGLAESRVSPESAFDEPKIFINDSDRIVWEEDLNEFVPKQLFDAHVHFWNDDFLPLNHPERNAYVFADLQVSDAWNSRIFPERQIEYLVLGTPCPGMDVQGHNAFIAAELKKRPGSRMNRLVTPQCSVDHIRRDILHHGFIGLKPYLQYCVTGDPSQCRIQDFLTHPQMELANELGLWVTMHLSRHHCCADEQNLEDLEEYTTRRYPKIKWILAHCARSFTYWPIHKAVDRLRQMPNIWYDTSAVSDVMAHYTLFSKEDHRRILYGSDNLFANAFHGKYVSMGRFWYQMEAPEFAGKKNIHTDARPILAIYDQLLAMKHAAQLANLSLDQVTDIFYRNARDVFGLKTGV